MKKLTQFFLVLGFPLLLVHCSCESEQKFVKNSPLSQWEPVVVFGDSLAYGIGASQGFRYGDYLSQLLQVQVIVHGYPGATSKRALRYLDRVLKEKPRVVLITLGGNDVLRRVGRKETLSSLRHLFSQLQGAGALVAYTAIRPPLIAGQRWDQIEELCLEMGVLYIPEVMDGFWGKSEFMADRIHPNKVGQKKMAERVFKALQKHYKP